MSTGRFVSTAAPRRDAALVALAAAALAVLLRQDSGFWDGPSLVLDAAEGRWRHPRHLLLLPALRGWLLATAPLGGSAFDRATWLNPVLLGFAAYVLHRAFARLRLARPRAALAAALACGTPAALFHASIVDKYLPGFAAGALAWFAAAALAADPRAWRALALGAAGALAYAVHAGGAILPLILLPLAFLHLPAAAPRWRLLGIAALSHVSGIALVQALAAWLDAATSAAGSASFFAGVAGEAWARPHALGGFLLQEWLVPFAPVVLLGPFARGAADRPDLRALWLAGTLGYLAAGFSLIQDFRGYGCYLLPLASLGAVAAAQAFRPGILLGPTCAGLAIGIGLIVTHEVPHRSQTLAEWIDANGGPAGACLLLAAPLDVETLVLRRPGMPHIDLRPSSNAEQPAAGIEVGWLDQRIDAERARGRTVLVSRAAVEWLQAQATPSAQRILGRLRARRAGGSSAGHRVE
ncbi:MAG: hypothetical protein IT458_14695 [Planctomycetes bacterium]|nr:hypothetical protein [Planctomycetota bacterium]